jgi:hypothetical protein
VKEKRERERGKEIEKEKEETGFFFGSGQQYTQGYQGSSRLAAAGGG